MRIGSLILIAAIMATPLSAVAGIKVLSPGETGAKGLTPQAKIQELKEQLLAAQAPAVQKRLAIAHMAHARNVDIEIPAGTRGGSITGSVAVSPEPLVDTYYDGAVLALDEYGYVAADVFWMGDYQDSYELVDVPPGDYYVFFMSGGWDWDAHEGTVINEFYNNTTDWSAASLVTVTEGGTTSGVDFDLASNSGYVEITLRDSQGQPIANTPIDVELYSCPPGENGLFDECGTFFFNPMTDASGIAMGPAPDNAASGGRCRHSLCTTVERQLCAHPAVDPGRSAGCRCLAGGKGQFDFSCPEPGALCWDRIPVVYGCRARSDGTPGGPVLFDGVSG